MTEHREDLVSRRRFAQVAGAVVATVGGVGAAGAQPTYQTTMPNTTMMAAGTTIRRTNLVTLSNALFNSPAERQSFLANPAMYANKMGLHSMSNTDLMQLKQMMADGFCCNGCGCSGHTVNQVSNPATGMH